MPYQNKGDNQKTSIHSKNAQTGDLGTGSKGQTPLDFFESLGICDGAPSNIGKGVWADMIRAYFTLL